MFHIERIEETLLSGISSILKRREIKALVEISNESTTEKIKIALDVFNKPKVSLSKRKHLIRIWVFAKLNETNENYEYLILNVVRPDGSSLFKKDGISELGRVTENVETFLVGFTLGHIL